MSSVQTTWHPRRRSRPGRPAYRPFLEPVEDRLLPSAVVPPATPPHTAGGPVEHVVRTYYLIPSNREAQPRAVESLQHSALYAQAWYQDLMERNGFGPRTFTIETEDDDVTPRVHLVFGPQTDDYYRADPWRRVTADAAAAGLPV